MQVEPSTEIASWLIRAREELGLSRQALATAAGLSEGTLRNAELSRHRITRQTATRLMQEIAKRDALLAYSAPSPLLDAGLTEAQRADRASRRDGSQPRPLIFYGTRDATQRSKTVGNERFAMLDPLPEDGSKVLMSVTYPRTATGAGTELVSLDTNTGRRKTLARAPRENCSLTLDAAKEARFALCFDSADEQGNYDPRSELWKRGEDGKWAKISDGGDGQELSVIGPAPGGGVYAYRSDRKAPEAFGLLDPDNGAFKVLHQDPVAEVSRLIYASDRKTVIAAVTEAGAPQVTLVDESHADAELYASLGAAFPGQMIDFSSATSDGKKIIVSVYSDRNPGELYLYDREAGKARFLMASRAQLDPKTMARVKPLRLQSRDGLTLYGYLTLPHGRDPKNLPLIVNPHGGPMGPRDSWGFNPEAQLFASRGYAVLQVNFRGSGGYGKAFEDMAYGQWRTGIMADIIDATRYVIDQGYADPQRVCIYGGSFGGYSALMAPAAVLLFLQFHDQFSGRKSQETIDNGLYRISKETLIFRLVGNLKNDHTGDCGCQ